jgi:aerobic-type carbon monoxide dehydrogenase small subunit (CoxS/CutS family)
MLDLRRGRERLGDRHHRGLSTGVRELHPVQQAVVDHQGLQCGFCTPGMVLSALALLEENPRPTEDDIRHAISGNLCRCTGTIHRGVDPGCGRSRG